MHRFFPSAIEGVRLPKKKLLHSASASSSFLKGFFFLRNFFYHKFININIFYRSVVDFYCLLLLHFWTICQIHTPLVVEKFCYIVGWKTLFTNTMKKMCDGYQATWKSAAPIVLSTRHCPIEVNCSAWLGDELYSNIYIYIKIAFIVDLIRFLLHENGFGDARAVCAKRDLR